MYRVYRLASLRGAHSLSRAVSEEGSPPWPQRRSFPTRRPPAWRRWVDPSAPLHAIQSRSIQKDGTQAIAPSKHSSERKRTGIHCCHDNNQHPQLTSSAIPEDPPLHAPRSHAAPASSRALTSEASISRSSSVSDQLPPLYLLHQQLPRLAHLLRLLALLALNALELLPDSRLEPPASLEPSGTRLPRRSVHQQSLRSDPIGCAAEPAEGEDYGRRDRLSTELEALFVSGEVESDIEHQRRWAERSRRGNETDHRGVAYRVEVSLWREELSDKVDPLRVEGRETSFYCVGRKGGDRLEEDEVARF